MNSPMGSGGPVLAGTGLLAPAEVSAHRAADFFRRAGYWRSPDRLPDELVARLRHEVEALAVPAPRGVRFDERGRVTHVDGVVDRSVAFHATATHPAILGPLEALLGPNIVLCRNRHNHASRLYPNVVQRLHRDVLQWSRPIVTVIVYLHDTDDGAGPTMLVPGSHYLPFVGTPNNGGTWMDEHHVFAPVGFQKIAVPMPAGGVLFFDGLVFHRSGLNTRAHAREAITFAYHAVDELATLDDPAKLVVAGEQLRRGTPLPAPGHQP
jgi:phytanoyl-CoA hydroxylase